MNGAIFTAVRAVAAHSKLILPVLILMLFSFINH